MKDVTSFLILIIVLFSNPAIGQSVQWVQDSIIYYSQGIEKWDTLLFDTSIDHAGDSLEFYNKHLLDYLDAACSNNPATLKANFILPENCRVNILTSDDKKFRIYCWYVGEAGTARSYDALAQYKAGSKSGICIE